jgi:class 3 adenylate cyclase/alpha-beta hydrolase superfamily lysophospholipase
VVAGDEVPETRYVSVGDADVAYQVLGDGPPDLLVFNGLGDHLELAWQVPDLSEFFTRMASLGRLILFDRRGTGMSDGVARDAIPTWEDLAEDAGAVLDAVGSTRAVILAQAETGPMALLFAAMHPQRVAALVLVSTYARYQVADDYPIGVSSEDIDAIVAMVQAKWGTPELVRLAMPSRADDVEFLERTSSQIRSSATPRTAAAQYDYLLRRLDVRPALPLVQVPTLVLNARDSELFPAAQGRYLADHIEGAKFVELTGPDFGFNADNAGGVAGEIAEFLTGERPVEIERILATVLFSDIADSTATAASLGDRRWRSMLDAHDRAVREQLRRFRGREINTTGDGFIASFDGPARAIRCAEAILEATRALGIEVRAGLHTGECDIRGQDLGGLAVHIAARVADQACPGEVTVSGTVKDLVVGSGIEFRDRGDHELKGVPGTWRLFAAST